jgi:hypothetical protein
MHLLLRRPSARHRRANSLQPRRPVRSPLPILRRLTLRRFAVVRCVVHVLARVCWKRVKWRGAAEPFCFGARGVRVQGLAWDLFFGIRTEGGLCGSGAGWVSFGSECGCGVLANFQPGSVLDGVSMWK